jgi:putative DNA primase/helicase
MTTGEILSRLSGVKPQGRGEWMARCPGHEDRHASLSIKEGDDGRTLLKDHAGCEVDHVVSSMNLTMADLFVEKRANGNGNALETTYDYRDEAGKLLFQVLRYTNKKFLQRKPDAGATWLYKLNGVRRVLYRLPELLAADPNEPVFLPEGEKDVDRLRAGGLVSTCNAMGAGSDKNNYNWRKEYSEFLRNRMVVILPDNDDQGRSHAQAKARSLKSVAWSVKVITLSGLPEKGDVSDWLNKGGTIETLRTMAEAVPEWTPGADHEAAPTEETETAGAADPAVVVAHSRVLDSILGNVGKVDFEELFKGITPVKQKHYLVASIEELLKLVKAQNYQLARKNDFVFAFNGEYWAEIDRETLKDFLMTVAQKQSVDRFEAKHFEFRDKLYKQFIALAGIRPPEPSDDTVLINLLNGTFEIGAESQDIREFRAADFLTHQLQFKYDRDATAPKFQAYLNRVLPEKELQDIVAEFFGYVFTKNLKLEKALLPYGTGANGKSVLFDVMNGLLGRENTANYSLSDLMEEHNRAQIAHKLLNYGSEINASLTRDVLKNLISCEPIMARLKYGNSFLMERYAKLCFNCNELPKDVEQTEAYFRRFLIIPFRVTLPESEWIVDLAQQIIKEELAGVFNWVLAGLKRILKQKKFTDSKIVREMIATYKLESDSVACFLRDENWGPDPHEPDHTETLKKVHLSYQTYCREAGHKPLGRNNFKKRLSANRIVEATKAGGAQEFYINYLGRKA